MRYFVSLVLGVVVGVLLFALMNQLISGGDRGQVTADNVRFVDFVRVKRDEVTRTRERQVPEKPEPPKKPPPPQMATQAPDTRPTPPQLNINMPNIGASFAGTGPYLGSPFGSMHTGDGEVIPIVQIEPQYPREALINCIGGVVNLDLPAYAPALRRVLPEGVGGALVAGEQTLSGATALVPRAPLRITSAISSAYSSRSATGSSRSTAAWAAGLRSRNRTPMRASSLVPLRIPTGKTAER
jgi:protein TonB